MSWNISAAWSIIWQFPLTKSLVEVGVAIGLMFFFARKKYHGSVQTILPFCIIIFAAPSLVFRSAYAASVQQFFAQHDLVEPFWSLILRMFDLISGIVVVIIAFGLIYRVTGIQKSSCIKEVSSRLDCIYFSAIVWCTVGFGDFVPAGKRSKLLSAYEALLGYFMLAMTFAEFSSLAAALVHLRISTPG